MKIASSIAVIPARGGSKRIPKKNLTPFFGHPMLAYTVSAALRSGLFLDVIVSTDDPETGEIAQAYGATYVARPAELATDSAGLVEVNLHVLDILAIQGIRPEALCQLMPNCPLRTSKDIVDHYSLFRDNGRSFQISVVPYRGVYPQWSLTMDKSGRGSWLFGPQFQVRSQELKESYCPTGALWWTDVAEFSIQKTFYGDPFHLAPMDPNRGIDIDVPEELELAELLVLGLTQRDGKSPLEPVERRPVQENEPNE